MSFRVKLTLTASVLLLSGAAAAGDVLVYSGEGAVDEGYSDFGVATGKTIVTQADLPGDLSVYDCIVLPANGSYDTAFSALTLAALNDYVNAGGRIIAEAEWSLFPGSVDAMNGLASDLGADLSVVIDDLDQNAHVTNNIDPSPFTAGVSSIGYAATSEIVVAVGPSAHSLVRTITDVITFIGVDQIGDGLFVLMGDTNVFSDNNFGGYINNDNGILAANLCDQVSIPPTLVLTPPGAYNLNGTSHTVKATLNGVARCEVENVDDLCTSDDDCGDAGTCSNKAGIPVGFLVSNLNSEDEDVEGAYLTDENGQVSYTYTDTVGDGTDLIQACVDLDPAVDELTSECIANASIDFTNIPSNEVVKNWGTVNLALTPESAYNPIGTSHVLTATSAGLPTKCSSDLFWPFVAECSSDADCLPDNGGGSCDLAGYPTFFAVVGECSGGSDGGEICTHDEDCESAVCSGGPNLGELTEGVTDGDGIATTSYSSIVEGEDRIMACLDGDPYAFGYGDEIVNEFIWCFNDAQYELDVPSNAVTKGWFANFITGGAGAYATGNKKKTWQFSGVIGKDSTEPGIHGQWNATTKDVGTGKTVSCHFNTFTSLVFTGSAATTPASTHNTATWTTGPGKCNDGTTPILTATAVDFGEGKKVPRDTIKVSGDPRFTTPGVPGLALTTGNLQVHSIILP